MDLVIDALHFSLRGNQYGAVVKRGRGALLHPQHQIHAPRPGNFFKWFGGRAGHRHVPVRESFATDHHFGRNDQLRLLVAGRGHQAGPEIDACGHVLGQPAARAQRRNGPPLAGLPRGRDDGDLDCFSRWQCDRFDRRGRPTRSAAVGPAERVANGQTLGHGRRFHHALEVARIGRHLPRQEVVPRFLVGPGLGRVPRVPHHLGDEAVAWARQIAMFDVRANAIALTAANSRIAELPPARTDRRAVGVDHHGAVLAARRLGGRLRMSCPGFDLFQDGGHRRRGLGRRRGTVAD
jgi:hypothetical protein